MRSSEVVRASDCKCQFRNSCSVVYIVPEFGRLRHRVVVPARQPNVAWRAGMTTLCRSQVYPTSQGLWIWLLGSIPTSSDTVESEGWQMKHCWINYIKNPNNLNVLCYGRYGSYVSNGNLETNAYIYTKQCISQLICKQRYFSAPMIFIIFHM